MTYLTGMLRNALVLALTALLVVYTTAVGVAQGQTPPADAITICTGHGTVTIYVDEDGTPVERQILCPDCALLVLPSPGDVPLPKRVGRLHPVHWIQSHRLHTGTRAGMRRDARAPPFQV